MGEKKKEDMAKVEKLKKQEKDALDEVDIQKASAARSVVEQHEVAKQLDETLGALMAKAIAAQDSGRTAAEDEAKEQQEAKAVEAASLSADVDALRQRVAGEEKDMADLQKKQQDEEDEEKSKEDQAKAVKKNPMPEVPAKVQKEASKAVKAVEKRKEEQIKKDVAAAKKAQKDTAEEEVQTAEELEKNKKKLKEKEEEAARTAKAQARAETQVKKAEEDATQMKYGAEAVLKRSEAKQAESSAKVAKDKEQKKIDEAMNPSTADNEDAGRRNPSKRMLLLMRKLLREKSAVTEIQTKLNALKTKISQPLLDTVEATKASALEAEAKPKQ